MGRRGSARASAHAWCLLPRPGEGTVHHPLRLRKLSNALDWLVWLAPKITPVRPLCQPRSKKEGGLVGGQTLGRSRAAYDVRHARPPAHPSSDDASAIEPWQRIPEVCTPKPLIPPMTWHFTGCLTETAPAMAANSRREYSYREFAATGGNILGRTIILPGQTCGHPGAHRHLPSQTAHIGTLPPGADCPEGLGEGRVWLPRASLPPLPIDGLRPRVGGGMPGCLSGERWRGVESKSHPNECA
jgi:hypothetical protein